VLPSEAWRKKKSANADWITREISPRYANAEHPREAYVLDSPEAGLDSLEARSNRARSRTLP
jgi:hypothetical protein